MTRTASADRRDGRGQVRRTGRFTPYLLILRFTTLAADRSRRSGNISEQISAVTVGIAMAMRRALVPMPARTLPRVTSSPSTPSCSAACMSCSSSSLRPEPSTWPASRPIRCVAG